MLFRSKVEALFNLLEDSGKTFDINVYEGAPLVTIAAGIVGQFPRALVPAYIAAQLAGAVAGVFIAQRR